MDARAAQEIHSNLFFLSSFFFFFFSSGAHDTCAVPPSSFRFAFYSKIRTSPGKRLGPRSIYLPKVGMFIRMVTATGILALIVTAPVEEELRMASRRWKDTKQAGLRSFSSRIDRPALASRNEGGTTMRRIPYWDLTRSLRSPTYLTGARAKIACPHIPPSPLSPNQYR